MQTPLSMPVSFVAAAALIAACASGPALTPPDVPEALRAPAGQRVFLELFAEGEQIYECAPKADQPGTFEWAFRGPVAKLVDRSGKLIGTHYGGPAWQANDKSKVVGLVKASDPGPDPNAIPWLLLSSKSNSGTGLFLPTLSIQRVQTTGGRAPDQPCDATSTKQVVRVPYTATYYFYR
jgi:Protein of unknown function (DUF3455)